MLAMLLVTLHVTANLVWIGSIACVGWLAASASKTSDASTAVLARGLYLRVAVPAFLTSFVCGASRLALDFAYYMHLHWFHGKLTAALAVIALHHVIGARSKKIAGGSMQAGRNGAILAGALLACAFLSVTFVVFRQALAP
jgi:putative membrane protein